MAGSFRLKKDRKRQEAADRQERTENLREWFERKRTEGKERAKDRRAELNKKPRGVDRVPEHLTRIPKWAIPVPLVEYDDDNYKTRRTSAKRFRTREQLPSGRRGKMEKVTVRPGSNQPYINEAKTARLRPELRR